MSNGEEQWPALEALKNKTNVEQRRVLRMHQETGFDFANDSQTLALRDRLDGELQIIMLRELSAQADPGKIQEDYADIPQFAKLIRTSPAFGQYLNCYYYFGVRFAAARMPVPCDPAPLADENAPTSETPDCNEPILGLPSPPLCPGPYNPSRDFVRFVMETASTEMLDPEIHTALRFLDDFVEDSGRPAKSEKAAGQTGVGDWDERLDFELWLRGLDSRKTEHRFEQLARGILKWADQRCRFYLSLEEGGAKHSRLATWRNSDWKEGRFNVNNPMAARCALVDFYWLSRILRADVSPRGLVAYQGHSWLYRLAMKRQPIAATVAELGALLGRGRNPASEWNKGELRRMLQEVAAERPVRRETAGRVLQALYPGKDPSDEETQNWAHLLDLITASTHDKDHDHAIEALINTQISRQPQYPDSGSVSREILRMEEVLRAVFSYACDLIQNAVERAEEAEEQNKNREDYPERPAGTKSWRAVYDEELREIGEQRREWRHSDGSSTDEVHCATCEESPDQDGWSRRIWSGEDVDNLVGVAFSGGGIRSATFNLGVLQHLQQLDLLRHVDYVSTVSGGGYIGAWLIGNVRRTRYWLSRLTSWDKSIEHLRRYSSYLSPENGLLRADTWTMWATWIRNAFLIQLTGVSWLAFFLVSVLAIENAFWWCSTVQGRVTAQSGLIASLVILALILAFYLWELSKPYVPPGPGSLDRLRAWALNQGSWFARFGAGIAWIGSFAAAALLWNQAIGYQNSPNPAVREYSGILKDAWNHWPHPLLAVFVLSLWLLGFCCFESKSRPGWARRALWTFVIALATAAVSYLALCGLLRLYELFLGNLDGASWYAFVFGPPAALSGITLAIAIYIGLLGRDSSDWSREWWTRYGAWIAMFGAAALTLSLAAVFAPFWVYKLFHLHGFPGNGIKAGTVAGWVGSVVSGLLAGKSSRTGKDGSSPALEWVARIGGLLFIVGAVALAALLVHMLLSEIVVGDFDFGCYWSGLSNVSDPSSANYWIFWLVLAALFVLSLLFSNRFDLNTFSLNQFYRNRLVRCYLGATRWQPGKRHPHRFTAFDMSDDIDLTSLTVRNSSFCGETFRGPLPIINCTLNLGGSSDLAVHTRQSAPFMLTPLNCGSARWKVGYISTEDYAGRVTLGQAISVSGAAASPNMGYNTSPLVSFLLTMFNVRLGWWFPNPATPTAYRSGSLSAFYLLRELFGTADEHRSFVNVSDGGHFENLGIYELIRRRARVIIAADAECDSNMSFGSLGNVIRICETDFGARIDIDVASLRKDVKTGLSHAHCAVGKIIYSNGSIGYLIYIKSSMTGDEEVGVAQYQAAHPSFPHETTADQFFSEDQFEAYRRLGNHIAERAFRGAENEPPELYAIASKLFDLWVPAAFSNDAFLSNAKTFDEIWDRFRTDTKLANLFREITGQPPALPPALSLEPEELAACMELLQLMENVFLELRLDDFWDHPDNRGWAVFFTMCAQSAKFQQVWKLMRHAYGIRFEYFCDQHLGLGRDRPVFRF